MRPLSLTETFISPSQRTLSGGAVLILMCAVAAMLMMTRASWASNVYEIKNIFVDVTAENVTEARRLAMREAEGQAIDIMLKRLTVASDHAFLPWVEPANRAQYIQTFSVQSEKTSATRYIATLNFTFKKDSIRQLLKSRNLSFAETLSKPVLILPLYEESGQISLWEDPNPWRDAWTQHPTENGLVPLALPLGDLADLTGLSAQQVVERDVSAMNAMGQRYGVDQIVVAQLGVTARNENQVPSQVNLVVQRFGQEQTSRSTTLGIHIAENETGEDFLMRIAALVHTGIEENWKSANLLQFGTSSILPVSLRIARLGDWVDVRQRLESVAVVQKVELALMSRDAIQLNIHFLGNIDQLITSIKQVNLDLTLEQESWFLVQRSNGRS